MRVGLQIAIRLAWSKAYPYLFRHCPRRLIAHEGEPTLKTVLILDNELWFVFWLGHLLDAAAYSAWPAKNVADAALLIKQLNLRVDILVVNLALPEVADFIAALQRSHRTLQVIGVVNDSAQAVNIPRVHAIQLKTHILDEEAKIEWLRCVQGAVAQSVAMVS